MKNSFEKFTDTKDETEKYTVEEVEEGKLMAVLAYLSWLVLIPLFAAKDSPFARFHTNQGLALFLMEILYGTLKLFVRFLPGWAYTILTSVCSILFAVLTVLGVINAVSGKAKELPLIGSVRLLGKQKGTDAATEKEEKEAQG